MIGYATLGTNDLPKAVAFYEKLFAPLGAKRLFEVPRGVYWTRGQGPFFGIVTPFDGKAASVGNGAMVAFLLDSKEQVAELHALALSQGGKDEGAPGDRGGGFYCGYVRDPDGNKLNLYHLG